MRRIFLLATLTTFSATIGCGGADRDAAAGAPLPRWTLALEARIGSVDDPELGLTRVSRVAFGPDSLLYIAQSAEHEIRAYGLDGTLRRRIGREGEGPGEFRSITAMMFVHDTMYVSDSGLRRVSTFDRDGNPIDSFLWASTAPAASPPVFYMPSVPQVVLPDGSALLQQNYGYVLTGQPETIPVPWLRIHRDSEAQDTIALMEIDLSVGETLTENGRDFQVGPPISDRDLWELMDDGTGIIRVERRVAASAEPQSFTVVRIGPSGDTIQTRAYDYAPVATPAGEVDRQIENRLAAYRVGRPAPSREGLARIYSQPGFIPPYLPTVSSVEAVQDGRLWLERERAHPDSTTWTAVNPDGELEGEIRLASDAGIFAGLGDLLAVVQLDELDVPYVYVYRIIRPD
jgi:hypothetical protein